MTRFFGVLLGFGCLLGTASAADAPKPLVTGIRNPGGVAAGPGGRVYVCERTDGRVLVVDGDKTAPFATGMDDPRALVGFQQWLFVADKKRVWRVDMKGKATELAPEKAFPTLPVSLAGITVDETGVLYVTDSADGNGGAVYRIDQRGKVTLVADAKKNAALKQPATMTMDGMSFLLIADAKSGELHRLKIADGSSTKVAEGVSGGVAWDHYGRLFFGADKGKKVHVISRPGDKPVALEAAFESVADLALDPAGKSILTADAKAGSVTALPAQVPGLDIDESPLPLETAVAFPDIEWAGWTPQTPQGKTTPFRPVLLTHPGDGSDRVFVATEQGVIHVFPNDQKAKKSKIFLDLQDRVVYNDKQNEEGFLGLAFHHNYKKNGEFFVFYTTKKAKLTNVISRFKVSKDDPDKADPDSEEVLLKIEKPYWNHDGGTLCFGPDGFLYFTHGDGGLGNDPHKNGQNKKTLLGKVLRIDVDHKSDGKNYAIPKDNPFVDDKDAAGEIWALGLRNIWRMSFDRKTGKLWAGDVGQNLYEEIDIITKGGNYGWSVREGLHPFGNEGSDVRKDLIEPIWEYDHVVGKCIIGGHVYRGTKLPELDGHYIYADYVTGKLWALRYDEDKRRVVANRTIKTKGAPVLSFGEDEKGEVYLLEESLTGKGIRSMVRTKEEKK
jgi:glucose/arabinose dehydrogenase